MDTQDTKDSGNPDPPRDLEIFRKSFERAVVGMAQIQTATGRFLRVNRSFAETMGYSQQELEGLELRTLVCQEDLPREAAVLRHLMAGEIRDFTAERRYLRRDGSAVRVNVTVSALWEEGEPPGSHLMVVEDITRGRRKEGAGRRRAEEERWALAARQRALLAAIPDIVMEVDSRKVYTWGNQPGLDFFGDDVIGREANFYFEGEQDTYNLVQPVFDGSEEVTYVESWQRRRDGQKRLLAWWCRVLKDEQGRVIGAISSARDITERQRAEESLRASEEQLRALSENLADGMTYQIDSGKDGSQRRFTYVSSAVERLHDLKSEEVMQNPALLYEQVVEEDRRRVVEEEAGAFRTRTKLDIDVRVRIPSGAIRWRRFTSSPRVGPAGTVLWDGIEMDITERKQAEAALRESEHRFRAIFNATFQFMGLMTPDGRLIEANQAALDFAGVSLEEVIDRPFWETRWWQGNETRVRQLRDAIKRAAAGEFVRYEVELQGAGSTAAIIDFSLKPVFDTAGQVSLLIPEGRDITERKRADAERERLQAQLTQAQKMESIGRLAGGVAHDFNNMLQAILGNASLALESLPPGSQLRENLEEIQSAAERSAELTRQLLAFARKQTIAPRVVDLNETVVDVLKMLRHIIGEDINLSWKPDAGLWPVSVDPGQIGQILANLCVNARDAIAGAGRVTIETGKVTFDERYTSARPDCAPGDYVMLAVTDNGAGMDQETQFHLFEPFFTTKAVGKGTGLGLATVFGIVRQNHGLIDVDSRLGQGTTFRIYLPRAEAEAVLPTAESIGRPQHGSKTILIVEDEEQVLSLTHRILERLGYTVLAAPSPQAGMAVAGRHPGPIDLLITDVIMPVMNGKELREQLMAAHPGLKCLFISGYTADVIAHHGVLDEGVDFLQKPFSNRALAAKVEELLAQ